MPLPIPNLFAGDSGDVPASQLDANFNAVNTSLTTPGTIASATTTDLGTKLTNNISITGAATINSFGASAVTAQPLYFLTFTGAATLTYNATSMILPSAGNIITAAGDSAIAWYLGSGNWRVLAYYPASGQALVSGSSGSILFAGGTTGGTANAQTASATGFTLTANHGIIAKIGTSNNGAMTLNVNSTGVKNVYVPSTTGPFATVGGEAIAGNIGIFVYDGTQYQLVDKISAFETLFISTPVLFTAAGQTGSQNHNLGAVPTYVRLVLRNINADGGYSTGDEVEPGLDMSGNGFGASYWANSTQVGFAVGLSACRIYNKSTGDIVNVAVNNWNLVIYASL